MPLSDTVIVPDSELRDIRNRMIAKPLDTDDYRKVLEAVTRLRNSVLDVRDPSRPWSASNRAKPRALVVAGAFRSGKTYAIEHSLRELPPLEPTHGSEIGRTYSSTAPSNFDMESLCRQFLSTMKLLPQRKLSKGLTIERFITRVGVLKPSAFHIDEAQRLLFPDRVSLNRLPEERIKTFGFLRSLLDLDIWPLPLILSGTTELIEFLQHESLGFFRERSEVVFMTPLSMDSNEDLDELADALASFAVAAGMQVDETSDHDLYARLMRAADFARGLAFEICHEAIFIAAAERSNVVTLEHFATFFARKVGATRDANMFLAPDWYRINPKLLARCMAGEEAPLIGSVGQ